MSIKSSINYSPRLILLTLLLITSSNLGLINNIVSLKSSSSGTLLGIRDFVLSLILLYFLKDYIDKKAILTKNPLTILVLLFLFLTPIGIFVGLLFGGNLLDIGRETVVMLSWSVALVVAAWTKKQIEFIGFVRITVICGTLVAIGIFIEAVTFGQIRVVTAADVVAISGRSTPSGWAIMMVTYSVCISQFLTVKSQSFKASLIQISICILILAGSLLTQSRTFVVGMFASTVVTLIFSGLYNPSKVKWQNAVAFAIVLAISTTLTFYIGSTFVRSDFVQYFFVRYSVLQNRNAAEEYLATDARRQELMLGLQKFPQSPIIGFGLGSQYRDPVWSSYLHDDPAVSIHNVFGFFLFRFGLIGLFLYCLLINEVFNSLRRSIKSQSLLSPYGIGLSSGLINLFACAIFGNVFGTTYGAPLALITVGLLISYNNLTFVSRANHTRSQVLQSSYPGRRMYLNR